MNTQICIPVNEMSCIKISEWQLFLYIHRYAREYGFLWWHNDRNVFKYWLAHEITRKGSEGQKNDRIMAEDFDIKRDFDRRTDKFLIKRLCKN